MAPTRFHRRALTGVVAVAGLACLLIPGGPAGAGTIDGAGIASQAPAAAAEPPVGPPAAQASEQQERKPQKPEPPNPFLDLGTDKGVGGQDFMKFDRGLIKDQILQFIPPLLTPAFVGHAFVLPPGAFRVSTSARLTNLHGDDFFMNGSPNLAGFGEFEVNRRFVDLDLFYGFDLNRRHLHGFTVRLNIPYVISHTNGVVNPNGVPFIDLLAEGASQTLGDISVFLKKKVLDQGNAPIGLAVMAAVTLPTGSNDEKFGNDGYILARRPDPDGDGVQMSFDAMIQALGGPGAFFNGVWRVPAAMLEGASQILTPFPFNGGRFGRFSSDGRLPSVLQPGTGAWGTTLGLFLTRQFEPRDFGFLGRSALHAGILHQFNGSADGIDPGDKTTFFAAYVKPVYRDYVALDLTAVGFHQQTDGYTGLAPEPQIVTDEAGMRWFEFGLVERQPFTGGTSLMLAPSLIVSPDPQLRFTASGLFRVVAPDLGPAPSFVLRFGTEVTF